MKRVVMVSAKRTPFGRFRGGLAAYSPVDMAVAAGDAAIGTIDRSLVDQVILGTVLAAGQGMNVARQVGVKLNLPLSVPAWSLNMMCGSGLQAALTAVSAIRAGEARLILAGGSESMSQAPLLVPRPPRGQAPDATSAVDSMMRDGLVDTFSQRLMGVQTEELAQAFSIGRAEQDLMALRSQHLYAKAKEGRFFDDFVVPMGTLEADEHPRPETTWEALASLKPAFDAAGTVTAGNSSGVNDGAAMILLAERDFAKANGWPILAEWVEGIVVGCDPARMGLGPVHAIRSLFERLKIGWNDIDALEINEAFAAQTLACLKELELTLDGSSDLSQATAPGGRKMAFNAEGGAIALGHPIGASGARLLGQLAWKIARGASQSAIASLCIGGGMGIAALLRGPD